MDGGGGSRRCVNGDNGTGAGVDGSGGSSNIDGNSSIGGDSNREGNNGVERGRNTGE